MDTSKSSPSNIDKIRQLIFGEQLQDYDRRFQEMLKKMDQITKSMQNDKKEAAEKLTDLEQRLDKRLSDQQKYMQKEMKTKFSKIGQELHELENRLSNTAEDKVDRNLMADQLINLAMQLKQSSIMDQIEGMSADAEK